MKNKAKQVFLTSILAAVALLCSAHAANAQIINISKAVFARQFVNGDATDVKVVFSPKDKVVYCVIGLSDPAPGSTFKFVWRLYNNATRQRSEVFQQELANQTAKIFASKLSSPGGLTEGFYEVDVSVDGRIRKHLRFPVVKDQFEAAPNEMLSETDRLHRFQTAFL